MGVRRRREVEVRRRQEVGVRRRREVEVQLREVEADIPRLAVGRHHLCRLSLSPAMTP